MSESDSQARRKFNRFGCGSNNVVGIICPPVGIGLIDFPKNGGASGSPGTPGNPGSAVPESIS